MHIENAHFYANNIRGAVAHLRQRAKALVLFASVERGKSKAHDLQAAASCQKSWEECKSLLVTGEHERVLQILASYNIFLKKKER